MSAHRRALLSLHDVSPYHAARLERAEAVFEQLGVRRIAYLLIPDYHGRSPADDDAFVEWCRRERPFEVEWLLHGYYHREMEQHPSERLSAGARLQRRYLTAGEGEFAVLPPREARQRVLRGMELFERILGRPPHGFVPPAWLYHPSLPDVLHEAGLDLWEDRRFVYTGPGRRRAAPVITWATRTFTLRWSSILGTPLLSAAWSRRPLIRLAVHPFDFDHPPTEGSIRRVWARELGRRRQLRYADLAGA